MLEKHWLPAATAIVHEYMANRSPLGPTYPVGFSLTQEARFDELVEGMQGKIIKLSEAFSLAPAEVCACFEPLNDEH